MPRSPRGWKVWTEPGGKHWRCRWVGKYGIGQQVFFYEADAKRLRDKKRIQFQSHDAGLAVAPSPPSPKTVGQVADEYLLYSKKEKSRRTYRNFDSPAIASLRGSLGDGRLLLDVSPSDVQKWKHSLPKTSTALMLYRQGVAFFNYAVRMKYLADSPAKGLTKPPEGPGGRALTNDEIQKLLDGAPEALYRTGTFSMNTCLRLGEISMLRWEWISKLPSGVVIGRIPWELRKGRRKVKKDCVFIINDEARAVIGEPRSSGRVFPWSPSTIQHLFVDQREAHGLPDGISFHSFRHTAASHYMRNGHMEDLLDTQIWTDPRSLLRYIHVNVDTLAPRFGALGRTFPPLSGPQQRKPQGRRPQGF